LHDIDSNCIGLYWRFQDFCAFAAVRERPLDGKEDSAGLPAGEYFLKIPVAFRSGLWYYWAHEEYFQ
jgi:hypothetical protein